MKKLLELHEIYANRDKVSGNITNNLADFQRIPILGKNTNDDILLNYRYKNRKMNRKDINIDGLYLTLIL
jgi:hypothetical protein